MRGRRQIEIYCKACKCFIRKYQWGRHKKTAKHIRNGGPEMEEEERKRKEEEKKKLEEAEGKVVIEMLKRILNTLMIGRMVYMLLLSYNIM